MIFAPIPGKVFAHERVCMPLTSRIGKEQSSTTSTTAQHYFDATSPVYSLLQALSKSLVRNSGCLVSHTSCSHRWSKPFPHVSSWYICTVLLQGPMSPNSLPHPAGHLGPAPQLLIQSTSAITCITFFAAGTSTLGLERHSHSHLLHCTPTALSF